jgi:hypothetical protein
LCTVTQQLNRCYGTAIEPVASVLEKEPYSGWITVTVTNKGFVFVVEVLGFTIYTLKSVIPLPVTV